MAITMPIPCQRLTRSRNTTIASTTVAEGSSEIMMLAKDPAARLPAEPLHRPRNRWRRTKRQTTGRKRPRSVHALGTATQFAKHVALGVAAGHVLAFVVRPLAACQCELDLDLALGEIQRQRH
jgi:hypothetical protein